MLELILPPLRQSAVETAACPRAYVEIVIKGNTQPDSIPSERGQDIHHVMSEYVRHCTRKQVHADWEEFDRLSAASGPVAGPILDRKRDAYEVDFEHVYATEITLMLDEDFNITNVNEHGAELEFPFPGQYSGKRAAHKSTLDVVLISDDMLRAKIPDYKSHPAPFPCDKDSDQGNFQATLYAFMLFKHMPSLQHIKFELDFVRYFNCMRDTTFTRQDIPDMQAKISRARQRQIIMHERPDEAKVYPCKTCAYCPLAKTMTCPIAEWNEHTALDLPHRLMWREWMRRMKKPNDDILKSHAEVTGPIQYTDGNGKRYVYGPEEVPETKYPLDRTSIGLLEEHKMLTGEDLLDGTLNISSTKLKSRLGTEKKPVKKRAALRERFEESVIMTSTKPKYVVRTPDSEEPIEDYNPWEEED